MSPLKRWSINLYNCFDVATSSIVFFWIYFWNKYVLKKKCYCLSSWLQVSFGKVVHNNWGDDINYFFLNYISEDKILPLSYRTRFFLWNCFFPWLKNERPYFAIGSVMNMVRDPRSIIWGTGTLDADNTTSANTCNVLAVRGPLTRGLLLAQNIACPEVYGDPAMLLPYYYQPSLLVKRYKLGIVTHYSDYDKPELDNIKKNDSVLVINMRGYKRWTDIVDQICSCEFVASSSLHGLIVAEAYHIPNLWIEIREPLGGIESRRFKFHDFFLSIGEDRPMPFILSEYTELTDILSHKELYRHQHGYSIKPLVQVCPYPLKTPINEFI